jgi:hypothetical protein
MTVSGADGGATPSYDVVRSHDATPRRAVADRASHGEADQQRLLALGVEALRRARRWRSDAIGAASGCWATPSGARGAKRS